MEDVSLQQFRLFMGTAAGGVSVCRMPVPPLAQDTSAPLPVPVAVHGCASGVNRAVQCMTEGRLGGVWLMALARKDATVDIVALREQAESSPLEAVCLFTLKEERMRVGVERWIGVALADSGLYTCTSSGFFRYTKLKLVKHDDLVTSGEPTLLEFTAPLHSFVFHPATNPKWFAYGGEEVDLSLWHLQRALSKAPAAQQEEETATLQTTTEGNSKERKRKRQAEARAKARELHWGEIWRAKSLPNDALSLPQRPSVTAIALLAESDSDAQEPAFTIAAGTRGGLVRIYNTGTARKAAREIKVVAEGAVKLCMASRFENSKASELFITDTAGKLYAMELSDFKINYSYADITGAVSAILPLPAPKTAEETSRKPTSKPLVISAALDQQIRLHSTAPQGVQRGASKKRGATLYSVFAGAAPTSIVWDGVVPLARETADEARAGGSDDEEDLFDNMGVVGGEVEQDSEEEAEGAPKKKRST